MCRPARLRDLAVLSNHTRGAAVRRAKWLQQKRRKQ
jgi:hypothetical protein